MVFLLLEREVHDRLTCVYIEDCHGHHVVNVIEHKQHDPITNLEFKQVFVSEDVEQLVSAKIPDSEAFVLRMLSDNFPVEIVHLHEVRVLQSQSTKQLLAFCVASAQVF